MDGEIVLFLRDRVPEAALQAALTEAFGLSTDAGDAPLVVDYAQGFALGISIPCNGTHAVHDAASALARRLGTVVLLESGRPMDDDGHWLLFAPGTPQPFAVQVVELRHGLDVILPVHAFARSAGAAHA